MKSPLILVIFIATLALAGCGGDTTNGHDAESALKAVDSTKSTMSATDDAMYDRARTIFYSMPSPIELHTMITGAGGHFREDLLLDPQLSSDFQSTEQQAFALGVYGSDMSYSTVFDQQQSTILYLAAVQRVAKKMGISDPFTGDLLERANNNIGDKDSMTIIVSEIYWELNGQLQEDDRNQIGMLVLAAGWVEAIYLGTQIIESVSAQPEVSRILMEQRFVASQLHQMFLDYSGDPLAASAEKYFRPLIDKYLSLPMEEEVPTVSIENGQTLIGSAGKVIYSDADLQELRRIAADIRTKITKP